MGVQTPMIELGKFLERTNNGTIQSFEIGPPVCFFHELFGRLAQDIAFFF